MNDIGYGKALADVCLYVTKLDDINRTEMIDQRRK